MILSILSTRFMHCDAAISVFGIAGGIELLQISIGKAYFQNMRIGLYNISWKKDWVNALANDKGGRWWEPRRIANVIYIGIRYRI